MVRAWGGKDSGLGDEDSAVPDHPGYRSCASSPELRSAQCQIAREQCGIVRPIGPKDHAMPRPLRGFQHPPSLARPDEGLRTRTSGTSRTPTERSNRACGRAACGLAQQYGHQPRDRPIGLSRLQTLVTWLGVVVVSRLPPRRRRGRGCAARGAPGAAALPGRSTADPAGSPRS